MNNAEKILAAATSVFDRQVSPQMSQSNCADWTSLKTLQIIMALDEMGIVVPFEKIVDIHSIQDIIDLSNKM
jgi:acyl carrier protein